MLLTDQTLMEQMKITEREIDIRKDLFDITPHDEMALRTYRDSVVGALDQVVGEFYAEQVQNSEIAMIIGDAETLRRLQGMMRRYVTELFQGQFDTDYVNNRLRIGKIHHRLGVTPKLYLSAIKLLHDILKNVIDRVQSTATDAQREHCKDAVHKVLQFDAHFVFDTYIRNLVVEVEMGRAELERHASNLEEKVAERTRQLEELARRDSLTGLLNQRAFFEQVDRDLASAIRYVHPITLVYIDLNDFKAVNDLQGHRAGDAVLAKVGEIILSTIRDTDTACRYGGDEFCVALPHGTTDDADRLCRRLTDGFRRRNIEQVTMSMGIAQTGPDDFVSAETLLQMADAAMYEAKNAARAAPGHQIRVNEKLRHLDGKKGGQRSEADEPPSRNGVTSVPGSAVTRALVAKAG